MSLVRAIHILKAYVNLPEAERAELDALLAELEAPAPAGNVSTAATSVSAEAPTETSSPAEPEPDPSPTQAPVNPQIISSEEG